MRIISLNAREILDSRGEPTVEAVIETGLGLFRASAPSGISRGKYEAIELRDGGKRFFGRGVLNTVKNIEEVIAPKLKGEDAIDQKKIDEILISLDGAKNKAKLGVNGILAVSMVCCRAGAFAKGIPLHQHIREIFSRVYRKNEPIFKMPKGCFNVLNGGRHAGNDLNVQEFMIVPQEQTFKENYRIASEVYHSLKNILIKDFGDLATNVGQEGGFAPSLKKTKDALNLLSKAGRAAGYFNKIKLGLDIAASEFFVPDYRRTQKRKNDNLNTNNRPENCKGKYFFEGKKITSKELLKFYQDLIASYPILFLEDPFSQDDWQGWETIMSNVKCPSNTAGRQMSNVLIVGDDLTVTNPERIKMARDKDACNGIIIKPNQIGTISETLEAAKMAKDFDWKIIVSHRSGDTGDDFIADLAVGIDADFIKSGAPARGERVAKYNRLLEIEEELQNF